MNIFLFASLCVFFFFETKKPAKIHTEYVWQRKNCMVKIVEQKKAEINEQNRNSFFIRLHLYRWHCCCCCCCRCTQCAGDAVHHFFDSVFFLFFFSICCSSYEAIEDNNFFFLSSSLSLYLSFYLSLAPLHPLALHLVLH